MHYYKKNIGDYAKKTGRLTMLEHGAYTLLLDACYDRERFPTKEEAIDWTWARTEEEVAAVEFVLSKFFTLDGDRYVQSRVEDELLAYHDRAAKNAQIARDREEKRRKQKPGVNDSCTTGSRSVNESPPNHKPLTTNQEPLTKNHQPRESQNTLSEADASTSEEPPTNEPKWTPEDKALADYMLTRVRDVSPSARGSRSWPDHIRLMRERDRHSHDAIRAMFDWANADAFWRANILSPAKLREKWPQLEAKRGSSGGGNVAPFRKPTTHSGFDAVDYGKGIDADGRF